LEQNRGTISDLFNIDNKKKKLALNRNLENEYQNLGFEIIVFDDDGEIRSVEECTMDAALVVSKRLWK